MTYNDAINSHTTVLVEFYATWCPHCRRMMPVVEQIGELLNGQIGLYQFDIDKYGDLADQLGVESTPTFIVYKDGKEEWRQSGEMDGNVLLSHIQRYM